MTSGQLLLLIGVPVGCAAGMIGSLDTQVPPLIRATAMLCLTLMFCTLAWKR